MKRYGKDEIPSVELEKGVDGCPFLPFGNRNFVEFPIKVQGMVQALTGSAFEDALQLDVTGPVTPAKTLQGVFRVPNSSSLQVGSKLRTIPIGAEGTDGDGWPEHLEPKGMEVGGNGNRLVGFQ